MILTMYAIHDTLNGFTCPIPIQNEESAKRYLKDQVLGNPMFKNSPEDFSLWEMGTFDSDTGTYMERPDGHKRVAGGRDYA